MEEYEYSVVLGKMEVPSVTVTWHRRFEMTL